MTPRPDWDPGWNLAFHAAFPMFPLPLMIPGRSATRSHDPLTSSRVVFIGLFSSTILYVVAFWFIHPTGGVPEYAALIIALGIAMHIALDRVVSRAMAAPVDEATLVPVFRTAGFIGVGLAMAVELIAIVTTFFGAPFWVIVLGAAISFSGLLRVAPSQRVFRWCDDLLHAQGKATRMTEAWRRLLTDPPPPAPPPPPPAPAP